MGRRHGRREKRLGYRDISGRSQDEVAAIWAGFRFSAGSEICVCVGPWGRVQVWAATRAEGERVIRFALSAGGWGDAVENEGEWSFARASGSRPGQPGIYETARNRWGLLVSKRDGPDGAPYPSGAALPLPSPDL